MTVSIYRITEDDFRRFTEGDVLRILEVGYEAATGVPAPVTLKGDIATAWNIALGHADWTMTGPWLTSGLDLDTAVLISLFTDRLAASDDSIPDGTNDRRGWWGDLGEQYLVGSRLWLLDRGKLTSDLPLKCANYIREALQWMLDDGVAAAIEVETAVRLPSALAAQVSVFRQDGTKIASNFAWVWKGVS